MCRVVTCISRSARELRKDEMPLPNWQNFFSLSCDWCKLKLFRHRHGIRRHNEPKNKSTNPVDFEISSSRRLLATSGCRIKIIRD